MSGNIIRAPNHLGDCIMALAALQGLPDDVNYELLAPHWSEPLYRHLKAVKLHLIPDGCLHGLSAMAYQRRVIKNIKANESLLLTPSFSSALIFVLAGVKRRYGFSSDGRGFLLSNPISSEKAPEHRAEKYTFLLENFFKTKPEATIPRIVISPEATLEAERLFGQNGLSGQSRSISFAARAVAASRRWGEANYGVLAAKLIDDFGVKIIIIGTADEWSTGERIRDHRTEIVNLCGQTNIETAAALLSRSALFIGNDSGLAHLAGAAGIPLVVLSGADNPNETSPLASKKTVIIKNELECISCVKNDCPLSGNRHMQCMRQITVEEVFDVAARYLS